MNIFIKYIHHQFNDQFLKWRIYTMTYYSRDCEMHSNTRIDSTPHMWRHINLADVIVTRRPINFPCTLTAYRWLWQNLRVSTKELADRERERRWFGVPMNSSYTRRDDMCVKRALQTIAERCLADSLCFQINWNCRTDPDGSSSFSTVMHNQNWCHIHCWIVYLCSLVVHRWKDCWRRTLNADGES